jgi:hypothetical protein
MIHKVNLMSRRLCNPSVTYKLGPFFSVNWKRWQETWCEGPCQSHYSTCPSCRPTNL